jgi:hypothetical protein
MKPALAHFASLSTGIVMVGTVAVVLAPIPVSAVLFSAQEQLLTMQMRAEAPQRKAEILEEIERLGEHSWAGVYRTNSRWPNEIAIAPEAGFTLHHTTWCGNCRGYDGFGTVAVDDGSLLKVRLELEQPDDLSRYWPGFDDTLYFVPWGDLQFVVPESRMESFCAQVANDYDLPSFPFRHTGRLSEFSRHAGERATFKMEPRPKPPGKPQVPRHYQHLISDDPIACRIVALIELRRRPEIDGTDGVEAYDAVYSIDAGTDDGLAIGMHLFVEGAPQGRPIDGRVEAVERESARIQMRAWKDDRALADELVGLRATTRFERVRAR